jgi:hypothetical protein
MPRLGRNRSNPKELRSVYNANRFVNAMNLETNQSSGFLGVPIGDAEGFDKAIKSLEMIENNLEAYVPALQKLINDPISVTAPSSSDLSTAITSAQRVLSRISLTKLPPGDIETINDYKAKMDAYVQTLTTFRDDMLAEINRRGPPGPNNPRVFAQTQTDLQQLAERLSVVSQTITNLVNVYNSGVSQPVKIGGRFNPESDMYQTPDYILPSRFR